MIFFRRFRVRRNFRRLIYRSSPEKLPTWERLYFGIGTWFQPLMCRIGKHDWDLCYQGPDASKIACMNCPAVIESSCQEGWVRTSRTDCKGVTKETYRKVTKQ